MKKKDQNSNKQTNSLPEDLKVSISEDIDFCEELVDHIEGLTRLFRMCEASGNQDQLERVKEMFRDDIHSLIRLRFVLWTKIAGRPEQGLFAEFMNGIRDVINNSMDIA